MRAVGYNETTDKVRISPYLPDFVADGILEVDFALLKQIGVKHLLMDLDQTLRQAYSRKLDEEVIDFFSQLSKQKMFKTIAIVSNNNRNLTRYSQPLGAIVFQPFWRGGIMVRKPSPHFYRRVIDELGINPSETVMIGDKVRLDVAGANRVGIRTVLVKRRGRDYWFDYLMLARWREYRTLAAALKLKSQHLNSTPDYIKSSLKKLGIQITSLSTPTRYRDGTLVYVGSAKKQSVQIKVLGRLAGAANWLTRAWRYLRPSWNGEESPYFGPKHILEHEAYVLRKASDAGIHVPEVIGILDLGDYRFGLATSHLAGSTYDLLPATKKTPTLQKELWKITQNLHKHHLTHGDCRVQNFVVAKDTVHITNFDFAQTTANPERVNRDYAELLVSMACADGVETSVKACKSVLKNVSPLLAELAPKRLSRATRLLLKYHHNQNVLAELRAAISQHSA